MTNLKKLLLHLVSMNAIKLSYNQICNLTSLQAKAVVRFMTQHKTYMHLE